MYTLLGVPRRGERYIDIIQVPNPTVALKTARSWLKEHEWSAESVYIERNGAKYCLVTPVRVYFWLRNVSYNSIGRAAMRLTYALDRRSKIQSDIEGISLEVDADGYQHIYYWYENGNKHLHDLITERLPYEIRSEIDLLIELCEEGTGKSVECIQISGTKDILEAYRHPLLSFGVSDRSDIDVLTNSMMNGNNAQLSFDCTYTTGKLEKDSVAVFIEVE